MSAYDHSKVSHFIGTFFHQQGGRVNDLILYLGGNSLDKAPAGRVKDFVQAHGGHTVITKVGSYVAYIHLSVEACGF
jgi:acetyl-CoA carboxylase/biotin carboxylase 1